MFLLRMESNASIEFLKKTSATKISGFASFSKILLTKIFIRCPKRLLYTTRDSPAIQEFLGMDTVFPEE